MTELFEAALAYAKRGLPVFPCRADKTPYTTGGVLDATTNPKQIAEWWKTWPRANIALDAGSAGMLVVDLDPGHDLAELEQNIGKLPATKMVQRTPRGGKHLFYALADGEAVANSAGKLAPHVDVRSFHGYVLLAPSKTADGSYEWESEGKPAFRSEEMLRLANEARGKHVDRDNWIIEADLPENVGIASEWLKTKAKIAVEGQGGDHCAYATAAYMKSCGISQELAIDLMWEHWNPRCVPPWGPGQIEHLEAKVEHAYRYNTSPPGNVTPAYKVASTKALFQPKQSPLTSGTELLIGRFRFVDREGMQHIKPPKWLIEDFLPEQAYATMFGAPGTFKTFIALDIALSIASGMPNEAVWEGITQSGPVLFCVGEGRPNFTKRVRAWEQVHFAGAQVSNFVLADPVPLVSEELEPFIEGALKLSPDGYKLVVVDTIGRAMQGMNESKQEDASMFTRMVEMLQHNLGSAVLSLGHIGAADGSRERGSTVFGADADTRLKVERPDKTYQVALSMVKQKDAQEWERPRFIGLREITLGDDNKALVAVKPEQGQTKAAHPKTAQQSPEERRAPFILRVVDNAVKAVLEENTTKEWTGNALAVAVARRDGITQSSETIRKEYLAKLREAKDTYAFHCYDAAKGKWRYVNPVFLDAR